MNPRRYLNRDRRDQGLSDLTGANVKDAYMDREGYPTLMLELVDGSTVAVTIDADPESNGPGFMAAFDLYPVKSPRDLNEVLEEGIAAGVVPTGRPRPMRMCYEAEEALRWR